MRIFLAGPSLDDLRRRCGKQIVSMFGDHGPNGYVGIVIDRFEAISEKHVLPITLPADDRFNSIWLVIGSTTNEHGHRVEEYLALTLIGRDEKCQLAVMVKLKMGFLDKTASIESLLRLFASLASNQISARA